MFRCVWSSIGYFHLIYLTHLSLPTPTAAILRTFCLFLLFSAFFSLPWFHFRLSAYEYHILLLFYISFFSFCKIPVYLKSLYMSSCFIFLFYCYSLYVSFLKLFFVTKFSTYFYIFVTSLSGFPFVCLFSLFVYLTFNVCLP